MPLSPEFLEFLIEWFGFRNFLQFSEFSKISQGVFIIWSRLKWKPPPYAVFVHQRNEHQNISWSRFKITGMFG